MEPSDFPRSVQAGRPKGLTALPSLAPRRISAGKYPPGGTPSSPPGVAPAARTILATQATTWPRVKREAGPVGSSENGSDQVSPESRAACRSGAPRYMGMLLPPWREVRIGRRPARGVRVDDVAAGRVSANGEERRSADHGVRTFRSGRGGAGSARRGDGGDPARREIQRRRPETEAGG